MNSNSVVERVVAVIESTTEEDDRYDMIDHMPEKIVEISAEGFKDRTKRRLSLPISGSRKSSIVSTDGSCTEKETAKSKRRHSIRRDSNLSCSSWSESYTEYSDDADDAPRSKNQKATNGFSDFCVRNIETWKFGRHEIEFAENEMEGLIKLRDKVRKYKVRNIFSIFQIYTKP